MTDDVTAQPPEHTPPGGSEGSPGLVLQVIWLCPACGLDCTAPAWILLDLEQRPELWSAARAAVACPECSVPAPQQPPLVVTGTPVGIPVLIDRGEPCAEPRLARICRLKPPLPEGPIGLLPHAPVLLVSPADAEVLLHHGQLPPSHATALDEARAIQRRQDAVVAMISATTAHELEAVTVAHPDLLGRAVLAEWQEHGPHEDPDYHTVTTARQAMDQLPATLLDDLSRIAADEAWQRYTERLEAAMLAFRGELEEEIAQLAAAYDRGEASRGMADRCAQLAEEVLQELDPGRAGLMWSTRALMLISPLMSAPQDIEDAIEALEHALECAEAIPDVVAAAEVRSNLVVALHTRPRDRERSLERGITLLEELVVHWESLPDPQRAALARTNLAVALLDRKTGDHLDSARQALAHCEAALQHRTRQLNAVDYVYTLVNKALAHSRLAALDEQHLQAAEQAYEEALDALPPAADTALLGRIFYNYTNLLADMAQRRPQDQQVFLARATECARRTVAVHEEHQHIQELAFARRQLARTLLRTAADSLPTQRLEEARALYMQALDVLTPDSYPADCIVTADEAVHVCQTLDDWQGASRASLTALAAWLASAGDTVGREDFPLPDDADPGLAEQAHDSRFRFTSYTLFRVARQRLLWGAALTDPQVQSALEDAVGIMEAGRATALRAASGADVRELQQLRSIDPQLAETYLSAVAAARAAAHSDHPAGPTAEAATSTDPHPGAFLGDTQAVLDRLLAVIRNLPALSDFARGQRPSLAQMRTALTPGQALVYLIAHPLGCCALIVMPETSPVAVVPVHLPATHAGRLVTLMFGAGPDGSPDGRTPQRSRADEALITAPSHFYFPRFRRVLNKVLAEIGRTIAEPLARSLTRNGVHDAVIVPCGLLSAFSWHAATWREEGETVTLSDQLDSLSYIPSAGAWLAARKRAARLSAQPPFLVGLANPSHAEPQLPGAEAELRQLATCFPAQRRAIAYGGDATRRFLLSQIPHATHLHLGCHGSMRYDVVDGTFVTLADAEQLDVTRIRRLAGDDLRLVVVAACVSGTVNVILQPEESHALTISFMHAGAAGVLGALWPIPDLPTALFITRFYEELTTQPATEPAVALARTQRWIRALSTGAARRYVAERPALAALEGRGRLRGVLPATAGRGMPLTPKRIFLHRRPFSAPEYWAAFVLNGC